MTFGSDNLRFSADFPGVMCKVVEKAFGGKPLVVFMQGAAGDINVYDAGTSMKQDAIARRDWAGETLLEVAVEVAEEIQNRADPDPSIDCAEDLLTFHLRSNPQEFRQGIMREIGPKAFQVYAPSIQETMKLPVTTVLIDRKIAMMGMPGEPFVEFQMNWRGRCPVKNSFFMGFANGYFGYLPTIQVATEGGYGAAHATTWVQVGAGERVVDHAIIKLDEMLGRLQDAPRANWK